LSIFRGKIGQRAKAESKESAQASW